MIRWQKSDKKDLQKAVRNFNSKIKRLQNNENKLYLPETLSYKNVKNEILSRRDLNKTINSLKRFSKKGAENIYVMQSGQILTNWERRELGIQSRTAQIMLNNELKQLYENEVTIAGKGTGFTYAKMGNKKITEIKAKINALKNIESKKGQEFNRLKFRAKRYSSNSKNAIKAENYKEHYLNALNLSFGKMRGKKELYKELLKINPKKFYDLISSDDFLIDFVTFYDFKGNQNILDKLIEGWENVLDTDIYKNYYTDNDESIYENKEE